MDFFEELRQRVPNMTRQIPWLRVFVEGVVIVGSNLLASDGAKGACHL